jgi:hypothetical protein
MAKPGFISVVPYNSTTPAAAPLAANMEVSELAVNSADRKLFTKSPSGVVVTIGNGATGAGGDQIFVENGQTVTASYTLPVGFNAMSTGPIAIADGVLVTIPSGSVWAII